MTAVRWIVEHPGEPPIGGWVEYPDETNARTHAGTAGTVWALVPAEYVRLAEVALEWAKAGPSKRSPWPLLDAAAAVTRLAEESK